jgi:hypothetical protein|nr:MAG: hypothetical protein J07AB56_10920 [Candidatus Nanosalinarum sp. J07AB56]
MQTDTGSDSGPEKQGVIIETQPSLEEGVTLLDKPENLPVFQALLGSELAGDSSKALWLDAENQSSTYALARHGESLMERVEIGKAFTARQHHSLIEAADQFTSQETELLVLPQITSLYLDGGLKEWARKDLFSDTWRQVERLQEKHGLKVLVSLPDRPDDMRYLVTSSIDDRIEAEHTDQGLKYNADGFNQLVYSHARSVQTTVPYWNTQTTEEIEVAVRST